MVLNPQQADMSTRRVLEGNRAVRPVYAECIRVCYDFNYRDAQFQDLEVIVV